MYSKLRKTADYMMTLARGGDFGFYFTAAVCFEVIKYKSKYK